MSIQNSALVRDNSTSANFRSWGSTVSAFFTTAGWTQSSDTGQVNWTTVTPPAANAYVYEIWKPGDGLQNFFFKVEYGTGTASGNTNPRIRLSVGTGTNGAGTLTGFVLALQVIPFNDPNVTSTSTLFQCYFSGDSGRMGMLFWLDDSQNAGGNTVPMFFAIQRSLNSSGTPYGTSTTGYVTLLSASNAGGGDQPCNQQSLVFNVGVSNAVAANVSNGGVFVCLKRGAASSDLFNGNIPISPVFPDIGYFDNPMDIAAVGCGNDFTERAQYNIGSPQMPYAVSHNYIATKVNPFFAVGQTGLTNSCLLMRYD